VPHFDKLRAGEMQSHYVEDLAEACGEGGRIVAFVQDTVEIKKIMVPSRSFNEGGQSLRSSRPAFSQAFGGVC